MKKTAIIIGAGPAGLTAAYELLTRTDIQPIIIEKTNDIGGISKTVNYKGNRIDLGGHRFFSKSERVMNWWQNILPIDDPEISNKVMLIRNRISRIYFLRNFFNYPISLNFQTLSNLGFIRIIKIAWTYMLIRLFPKKDIKSLEDFFINRFGTELYHTFFKDYTEKVWGVPCSEIGANWGQQRIKKLSITRTILHAIRSIFIKNKSLKQDNIDTSLIEQFMYPKFGPGQLWQEVANTIKNKGGKIILNANVTGINIDAKFKLVKNVKYLNSDDKKEHSIKCNYVFSTMPVKELIFAMDCQIPDAVMSVNDGLKYRDFLTVGLLLDKLNISTIKDNWIYIQEKEVKLGRIQFFNNWSPYMVSEPSKIWIGLEYFCNEGDDLWNMPKNDFIKFAIEELHSIGIINKENVIDSTLLKMPKAYPAYFGTYDQFDLISEFTDKFENLFLIGRNGMHRYNNMDHSMLTAITAVDNIITGIKTKDNIWAVNTEEKYHET